MMYLKQSTSVDVPVGPFLDETDGKTAETALTITQPDIRLKKNGGAWAQKAAAQTLTHEEAGWYELTLDATDTDTIGHLMVAIHESGALPVWREFHVLAANVYDSLFGAATDKLDVNVEEWNTTSVPAEHTAGYPIVTVKDGTGTGELDTALGVVLAKDHTGANLATAAALDTVDNFLDTEIASIITTLGVAGAGLTDIGGFSTTAKGQIQTEAEDALAAYHVVMVKTTIATLASQTSFTLTAGSADNDAYNGCEIVIEDSATAAQKAVGVVEDYTGATKTVTLRTDPAVFTMAAGDIVTIIPSRSIKSTVDNRPLDVTATGAAGIDWSNVENAGSTVNLAATTVNLVNTLTTYTGNTPQTGDSYAIVNSGTHGNAAIKGYVDDIGVAGAGLTAIPWNASWDAEVQSEVTDALEATIADSVPADGTRPSVASGVYMICQGLFEGAISGTTWTIKKVDGSTTLFTVTLDSATTPTSKTRAT